MDQIIVANLEANITKLIRELKEGLNLAIKGIPQSDYDSQELINAINRIKLEKNDLTGLSKTIDSISSKVQELVDKKVEFNIDDLRISLKSIDDTFKKFKIENPDLSKIEQSLSKLLLAVSSIRIPEHERLPKTFPLPEEQIQALKFVLSKDFVSTVEGIKKAIENLRISGGGGGADVVGIKNLVNGKEVRATIATDETAQSIAGFNIPAHDYIAVTYPTTSSEVYTYKVGGSGGTTVGVITVVYTSSTKEVLTSVTKS